MAKKAIDIDLDNLIMDGKTDCQTNGWTLELVVELGSCSSLLKSRNSALKVSIQI